MPDLPFDLLTIEDWRLRDAAVDARVVCSDASRMEIGPEVARAMLERYPTLAEHACSSHGVRCFGQVIEGTEAPHLVEHLAIDHLVAADRASEGDRGDACGGAQQGSRLRQDRRAQQGHRAFAGHTSWLDKERGAMRVTVGVASAQRGKQPPAGDEVLEEIQESIRWAVRQVNEALANRSTSPDAPENG